MHGDAVWIGQAQTCSSFAMSQSLPARAYFDVSFVDDAAVAIHSTGLDDLEALIRIVVEGFHHAAAARGLHINFDKGKTEVVWDIIGKGSRSLKERLHDAGNLLCWQNSEHQFCLRVSHSYKHLGSWMQVAGSHQREFSHRAGQALQSWGCGLARSFYQKSYVGLKAKTIAFQSLSMSRMMFQAHTWIGVTDDMLGHWQQKLRKPLGLMVRTQLRGNAPTHVDTNDLFALAQILPPIDQLHLARLRYLKRLLQFCPQGLWDMLHQVVHKPTSWLHLCQSSFAWFLQFYPLSGAPSDPSDLSAWLSYVVLDVKWKGRLKTAAKGCLCFRRAVAEHNVWFKAFQTTFVVAGGVLQFRRPPRQQLGFVTNARKRLLPRRLWPPTRAGFMAIAELSNILLLIMFAMPVQKFITLERGSLNTSVMPHNVLRPCRRVFPAVSVFFFLSFFYFFVFFSFCTFFYFFFFFFVYFVYFFFVIAMDEADHATTLELRAQGWGDRKALVPMRKIHGPCLPLPGSPDAIDMLARWTLRHPDRGSAFDHLQGHAQTVAEAPEPQLRFFSQDMPAFVFQSRAGMNAGDGRFSLHGLARETAILHIRTQVFVHFFSGYRRCGDLHSVLEQHVFPHGQQLFLISVDMCLQRERGDLASSLLPCVVAGPHQVWFRFVVQGGGPV